MKADVTFSPRIRQQCPHDGGGGDQAPVRGVGAGLDGEGGHQRRTGDERDGRPRAGALAVALANLVDAVSTA
ncbi:hypothetical protein [Streptomyces sp. NPDC048737]|uniref:hypothetical protein n=1 Tax=unclassified Streptomyces TaxID=2593676 RepID=UPI003429E3BF